MAKIKDLQKSTRCTLGSPNNSKMTLRCFLDDPRSILATFKKSQFSTKIHPNLARPRHQIDLREQKEDTGSKITKIDITPNAFFAGFELHLMHRSDKGPKFGAPLFGVSSPFGDAGCGIQDLEGRASPHSGFRIQDSRFRIQDLGFRIQDSGFKIRDALPVKFSKQK